MGPVSTWRPALTTRSREDVTVVLRDLLEEVVGAPPDDVTLESSLRDDLGADSLQLLDLAVMCERRLGVQISEEALVRLHTVGDFLDVVCGPSPSAAESPRTTAGS
jgi:acyl carrier protein